MGNMLKFRRMLCWETAKTKWEFAQALRRVAKAGKAAIGEGRIVKLSLKEMEEPLYSTPLKEYDRVALGLSDTR